MTNLSRPEVIRSKSVADGQDVFRHSFNPLEPSQPKEEFAEYSLPSISSLLGIAENSLSQQQQQTRPMSQHTADDQKNSVRYTSSSAATAPRQSLPLTPPTHFDLVLNAGHSPSSSISSTSQYGCVSNPAPSYFTARSTTNPRLNSEREGVSSAESRRVSIPLTQPQYGLPSSYVMAPAPQNMNNVNHQQPLLNFTPPSTNPWQHHHYVAPSSSCFSFPRDRYICPKCDKAFSRPSELRIHSRSHTGEKPFRCSVRGCGKKFSVGSNMKRHERGCHGGKICGEEQY